MKKVVFVFKQQCISNGRWGTLQIESEEEFDWMHRNDNQGIGEIEIVAKVYGDTFTEAYEMAKKLV